MAGSGLLKQGKGKGADGFVGPFFSFLLLSGGLLGGSQAVGFFSALPGIFLFESVYAASGIDKLLFTGKERVAA
jgi:hypothetical protein